MIVSLIAALAENRLLGTESGGIPWDLPRDRLHFRAHTAGKWLLLGRKTYEEMDGWFTDQTPLILTGNASYRPRHPAHRIVSSPAAAIHLARQNGSGELVVCGGAKVFAATLPFATRLVLTRIKSVVAVEHPVFFPDFESSGEWKTVFAEDWPADAKNAFPMRLEIHRKVTGRPGTT